MITIESPYTQFYDLDGSPLDSGYVYIGAANQDPETNPILVYWDRALTLPALQPLRTLNGIIARNGAPATVYAATDYSMMVRNARLAQVFYAAYSRGGAVFISDYMETVLDDPDDEEARATLGAAATGAVGSSGLTMATARLLGRTTASTGPVEEIMPGNGMTLADGELGVVAASTIVAGKVELPTNAETQAGLDTSRAVTPANLAATMIGGVGQAWQNMTGSRAVATNYVNTTGRPIQVKVFSTQTTAIDFSFRVDSLTIDNQIYTGASGRVSVSGIVPNGSTYSLIVGTGGVSSWYELR